MEVNKKTGRYKEEVWTKAIQDYKNGKSINQLAKEIGCRYSNVRKRFQVRGIKLRNYKEAAKYYSGELSPSWKGGRFIDHQNRVWLTTENGRILEAHYVWLQYHPNDILKGYDIHHKDENPQNNKIENLQKLTRSEHRKLHQSPTQNWESYAKQYKTGRSCADIAYELNCTRQCVWKNIKGE